MNPAAPIVERVAKLVRAADRLEPLGHGVEPKVVVFDGNAGGAGVAGRPDRSAIARRRTVDHVIEPPGQVVRHRLLVLRTKAGINLLANVRLAIAVGILQVPDIGRCGDEHTVFPGCDAGGPEQAVRKDVALVEAAVAVTIAQQADRAQRRAAGLGLVGIVAHLGNVDRLPPASAAAATGLCMRGPASSKPSWRTPSTVSRMS